MKLVEAAKRNPERFGVLYERYYRDIFLFVFKRCADEELAADVCSQVFLKAMLHLKRYEYKGVPFSAWLYRIASNEVNQHFRKAKSQRVISMEKMDIERMVEEAGGTEHKVLEEEQQATLVELLNEASEDEVQLLELRFFERRSFKEVAFILGITENNAKVKVYRLIERLKKRLAKKALTNNE